LICKRKIGTFCKSCNLCLLSFLGLLDKGPNFLIYHFKLWWLLLSLSWLSLAVLKSSTLLQKSHDLNIKPKKCQIWIGLKEFRVNLC
jgi:hypothetical protein